MRLDYARDTSHSVAMAHFIFLFRDQCPGQSVIRRRKTAIDQGNQCAGRLRQMADPQIDKRRRGRFAGRGNSVVQQIGKKSCHVLVIKKAKETGTNVRLKCDVLIPAQLDVTAQDQVEKVVVADFYLVLIGSLEKGLHISMDFLTGLGVTEVVDGLQMVFYIVDEDFLAFIVSGQHLIILGLVLFLLDL